MSAATKTQSGGQRSEDALGRRQPTGVCNRFGARDFGGKIPRQAPQARRPRASALFLYSSLFREPACGRAETAFSRSEDAVLDEDSKKGTNRCFFCQLATALGNFRFRRREKSARRRGTAAAPAARRSAGPCGWAAAARPDLIFLRFRGRRRRTSTRPARRDPSDGRLGRRVRSPAERQPRPHRSARRRTARGAAREADGSGDARTQGRAAAPPAGGCRRRARSGEDPKTKTPRRKRDACLVLMREFAARTLVLYPSKCLLSRWKTKHKQLI